MRNSCAINNTEYIGPLISERSGLAAWKLQYLRTIPLPSHCISQSRPTARSGRNINLEDWFPAFSTKVVWWLLHYNLEMNPVPKESIQLQQLLDHICQTNVPSLFNRKCNLKKKLRSYQLHHKTYIINLPSHPSTKFTHLIWLKSLKTMTLGDLNMKPFTYPSPPWCRTCCGTPQRMSCEHPWMGSWRLRRKLQKHQFQFMSIILKTI